MTASHGRTECLQILPRLAMRALKGRTFTSELQATAEQIWRKGGRRHYCIRRNTSEALVPPNPNELESAMLIGRLRGLCGTRSIAVATEGLSRLRVAGATSSRIASRQKIASTAPAAPRCRGR